MSKDEKYCFAFNTLAEVLEYGNVINSYCSCRDECEKTLAAIEGLMKKMKELVEKMEN
jgi:hypothetical protein